MTLLAVVTTRIATRWPRGDRGEVGPIGYAVMVAGIVLLAVGVVAWGEQIAELFMGKLEDVDFGE